MHLVYFVADRDDRMTSATSAGPSSNRRKTQARIVSGARDDASCDLARTLPR
jgi:hypothetical protein